MRANTATSNSPRAVNLETPELNFAAICRECGNGTLNNRVIPNFLVVTGYDQYEGMEYIVCKVCDSTHVNVEVL